MYSYVFICSNIKYAKHLHTHICIICSHIKYVSHLQMGVTYICESPTYSHMYNMWVTYICESHTYAKCYDAHKCVAHKSSAAHGCVAHECSAALECMAHTLIEGNTPTRGGFLFTMFPHQELCVRGPPSKNLVHILRGGSSYTRFLMREHSKWETPPWGGVSFDQSAQPHMDALRISAQLH